MADQQDSSITASEALQRLIDGNVMSPEIAGSLQYAGAHLGTPLVVISSGMKAVRVWQRGK